MIIDNGCLHGMGDEDRDAYVPEVTAVAAPGARLLLVEFVSGGSFGVPGIDPDEVERRFAADWTLLSSGDEPGMNHNGKTLCAITYSRAARRERRGDGGRWRATRWLPQCGFRILDRPTVSLNIGVLVERGDRGGQGASEGIGEKGTDDLLVEMTKRYLPPDTVDAYLEFPRREQGESVATFLRPALAVGRPRLDLRRYLSGARIITGIRRSVRP